MVEEEEEEEGVETMGSKERLAQRRIKRISPSAKCRAATEPQLPRRCL